MVKALKWNVASTELSYLLFLHDTQAMYGKLPAEVAIYDDSFMEFLNESPCSGL